MSEAAVDQLMESLGGAVLHILEGAGPDVAGEIEEAINVPVEYDGRRVIRSLPGEPPRRETGRLHDSVFHLAAEERPDVYVLRVDSKVEYAGFLEHGTPNMAPRPIWFPTEAKWEGIITNRLALATRQLASTP